MQTRMRGFYELFISAIYGFVLVLGFQNFVEMVDQSRVSFSTYTLLAAAYITTLHFWIVFFAAADDTFKLIMAQGNESDSLKMLWFWAELVFATLLAVPMLEMFSSLDNVTNFARGMMLVAFWSFLWDVWAFTLHKYLADSPSGLTVRDLLFKWTGLDILFCLVTTLLFVIIRENSSSTRSAMVSIALFSVSTVGAALDTIVVNPRMYLGVGNPASQEGEPKNP